ncbi:hypothetical protein [Emticicia sp. BO119]|uniref:hypothetical protein n=1 Tax=Emticicia sp. BO119 TaxID=2757768 RepID=UPI0015F05E88|nr:hypothetical protein [Emticicia sp. BO119]MBA4852968.1 hypothetical protein [Emticicia sp. BO119]
MKLLKALLFVCISFSTFSQKNYVKGYIILKNQTDTLKGLIDDQNWSVNPTKINFIDASNSEQSYSIKELTSFGITEKENYLIAKTDLDITPYLKNQLRYSRNLLIQKDTLLAFLILLKADYSLLYVKDNKGKEHFFYKDGEKITELINHFFLEQRNGKTFELNDKKYLKQLESLFSQCATKIETSDIGYGINALTNKFIEFSECIGCTYTCYVQKKKDEAIFTLGVMAGVSSDKISFVHSENGLDFQAENRLPNILVGINTSFSSARNRQKNSVVFESYISRESIEVKQNNFSANIYYLTLSLRLRHQFISRRTLKFFVGGGGNAKLFVSRSGRTAKPGVKLNMFYALEAGVKWNNFLLSANARVRTNGLPNPLEIHYIDNYKLMVNTISPDKINFQVSLTYLLYNSANKRKTKKES